MEAGKTVRLTAAAQRSLERLNVLLNGVKTGDGLSTKITPSRLVEIGLASVASAAEQTPAKVMMRLVRARLDGNRVMRGPPRE